MYDKSSNIKETEGDPIFIGSEYFKEDKFAVDNFYVQIYLATPPSYKSEFSIYKIDVSNKLVKVSSHEVKDHYVTAYIGKVDKGRAQKKYAVVSKLSNED